MSDEHDDAWHDRVEHNEMQEMARDRADEISAPTDQPPSEPAQMPTWIGNVLYAWQMRVETGWNIIGMAMPNGQMMPLVTTSLPMAWEALEVAQAHANRGACQVRLASFTFGSVIALVEPND
jgi:hypothetical protein